MSGLMNSWSSWSSGNASCSRFWAHSRGISSSAMVTFSCISSMLLKTTSLYPKNLNPIQENSFHCKNCKICLSWTWERVQRQTTHTNRTFLWNCKVLQFSSKCTESKHCKARFSGSIFPKSLSWKRTLVMSITSHWIFVAIFLFL
jgi:hypothetical protein